MEKNNRKRKQTKILLSVILAVILPVSCTSKPEKRILSLSESSGITESRENYIIIDYKNKAKGEAIPEWVSFFLSDDIRRVEAMDEYEGRFVFISRNEGSNFRALNQWAAGFSPELDFPRLATARIETRFCSSIPHPDEEYGAFFETLIRTSSDAFWNGAVRNDDFWIQRQIIPNEEEALPGIQEGENQTQLMESWEFFILVTIEKSLFVSQLDSIFKNIEPRPQPTKEQVTSANRVKDRFYDGF